MMSNNLSLKIKKRDIFWCNSSDKSLLVDALLKNKIAISSTDTIYGFLANCTIKNYKKILFLKECMHQRPFLILIASVEKLFYFVDKSDISDRKVLFLRRCWPGPVTIVFKAKKNIPSFLVSKEGTIALRCPDHGGLLSILPKFSGLFSTSANKTSDPPPKSLLDISKELLQKVDYVVRDKEDLFQDERDIVKPSTIIDFSQAENLSLEENLSTKNFFSLEETSSLANSLPFKVIREGVYQIKKLKEIYEATKNDTK